MLERKIDESFLMYANHINEYLDNGQIDYDEWADLLLGSDNTYSKENARKQSYFFRKILPKFIEDKTVSGNEMLNALEEQKNEIFKEKVKLQDQRKEYNKKLREEARFEHLCDTIKTSIEELPEIKLHKHEKENQSGVEAGLVVSDLHYGATVDNVLNFYNTDVCKERMNVLLDKTIYYCTLHRVNTLYIMLAGDLCHGITKTTARIESEENIIDQAINVAELLCKFIAELSKYVPNIKVPCVQGNHSRVSVNLNDSINEENFEQIIFHYIKTRLPDVHMIRNGKEDFCAFKIKDKNILLEHGDKTSVNKAKEKATNMLGYVPDDIIMGHTHHMEIVDNNGTEIIVNGSVMGGDSYSTKRRFNTKPYQILRIYGKDVATYKIMLDN